MNLKSLFSSRTSVPTISEGIRSGVNWILLKSRPSDLEIVLTSNVLASPGTPSIMQCPLQNIDINNCFMISSCPTITFFISLEKSS